MLNALLREGEETRVQGSRSSSGWTPLMLPGVLASVGVPITGESGRQSYILNNIISQVLRTTQVAAPGQNTSPSP